MLAGSVIVLGASGLIGSRIHRRALQILGRRSTLGTFATRPVPGLVQFDLEHHDWPEGAPAGPGFLVLCGAVTKLDQVFTHPARARAINLERSRQVVLEGEARGFLPVFLSTEKVYGSRQTPYVESAAGVPQTAYGELKWEMEQWLSSRVAHYLTVRLSKVYGTHDDDGSVLQEMTHVLAQGGVLRCCPKLLLQPTHVNDVADGLVSLMQAGCEGPWNLAHPDVWSRFDMGLALCRRLGLAADLVRAVSLEELNLPEAHPTDTRMDVSRFLRQHAAPMRSFSDALENIRIAG